jgi:hypothetical protein
MKVFGHLNISIRRLKNENLQEVRKSVKSGRPEEAAPNVRGK